MSSTYMQIILTRVEKIAAPYPMALTAIALVDVELNPWIRRVQKGAGHCELLAKPGPVVEAPRERKAAFLLALIAARVCVERIAIITINHGIIM
jgi:hypothetical protein